MVYRSIQGVTLGVDAALQAALRRLEPWLERAQGAPDESAEAERDAVLAALNGVLGDRLAADDNPLALPMALRQHGRALELAALHRGHGPGAAADPWPVHERPPMAAFGP